MTGRLLYQLIIFVLLTVNCTAASGKSVLFTANNRNDIGSVTDTIIRHHEFKEPEVISLDRCPKPMVIKVPVAKGGTYTINYATGPVKIPLLPPAQTLLPVSKEVSTGGTISNPEAQGIGFFTTFTTDQGLALDGLTDCLCDKEGYLWFCTAGGGVSRYDGKAFVNFTPSQGLANNSVWCVTQDRDGNVWFGTNSGGVSRYDGKTFTTYSNEQGLAYNYIYDITEDRSGNMWFSTVGGGVSRFDGKTFKTFSSAIRPSMDSPAILYGR